MDFGRCRGFPARGTPDRAPAGPRLWQFNFGGKETPSGLVAGRWERNSTFDRFGKSSPGDRRRSTKRPAATTPRSMPGPRDAFRVRPSASRSARRDEGPTNLKRWRRRLGDAGARIGSREGLLRRQTWRFVNGANTATKRGPGNSSCRNAGHWLWRKAARRRIDSAAVQDFLAAH